MRAVRISVVLVGIPFALVATVFAVWVYMANNVEQPKYRVVVTDGDVEVRDYPEMVVAEVATTGDRKSAISSGFRPLAAYIFAKDRDGDRIAMTAPVTQARETIAMTAPVVQSRSNERMGDNTWTVRFFMPSKHAMESLPKPAAENISLMNVPAVRRAAIRFSGLATDALIAEKEAGLRDWLAKRGMKSSGPPTYAYYNAPFTPGPMRRNEVWLDISE